MAKSSSGSQGGNGRLRRLDDIALTKGAAPRHTGGTKRRKPTAKKAQTIQSSPTASTKSGSKKSASLSQLLSPKNVQETMKTVGNLRGMVKNWLGYLQQADRALDTIFVTTTSLKESGVLDKLVKHRGKNLSSDDFTSILAALMSSPLAAGFLGGGGKDKEEPQTYEPEPEPAPAPQQQPYQQPQQQYQQQPQYQQPRPLPPGNMQPQQPPYSQNSNQGGGQQTPDGW